ncbi:unnamed protein product [Periconia digitata]|uniref:Uncharacterized protein n=1 Tax=Periconia digitata TaxID=1303443 RepID=A0A9W4UNG6_9PLEO|nr:unnamed protein product [Periconia digitata]
MLNAAHLPRDICISDLEVSHHTIPRVQTHAVPLEGPKRFYLMMFPGGVPHHRLREVQLDTPFDSHPHTQTLRLLTMVQ